MRHHHSKDKKTLVTIWDQVPVNYYENGERNNLGQRLWHSQKRVIFSQAFASVGKKGGKKTVRFKILDVGSADGHLTGWLTRHYPGATVWGIDVVPKLIAAAKKKYPRAHFRVADAHHLPFKDNAFDLVVCSEVLEHVVDPVTVCREIKRVLKTDGSAVLELDTGNWLFSFLWFFWTRFGAGRVWQDAHLHQFNGHSLPDTARKAGLKVKKKLVHHLGMAVTVIATKKSL